MDITIVLGDSHCCKLTRAYRLDTIYMYTCMHMYLRVFACSVIVPILHPAMMHCHKVVATQLVAMVMGECSAVHLCKEIMHNNINYYTHVCS